MLTNFDCKNYTLTPQLSENTRPLHRVRVLKTLLTMDGSGLGNEEGIKIANVMDWLLKQEERR